MAIILTYTLKIRTCRNEFTVDLLLYIRSYFYITGVKTLLITTRVVVMLGGQVETVMLT